MICANWHILRINFLVVNVAARKTKGSVEDESSGTAAGKRVGYLLRTRYACNRSAMAEELRVAHTTIGRVVSGERPPGRQLLAAIAGLPGVNPAWLLSGQGEPFLKSASSQAGWLLPIAKRFLPGSPLDHASLLSKEFFPVAGTFYRPSRYWHEIQPAAPIVRDGGQGVLRDDLLLFETDRSWMRTKQDVDSSLCIVRSAAAEGALQLAKVIWHTSIEDRESWLEADHFPPLAYDDERSKRRQQFMSLPHITLADIVAVSVLLVRR